MLAHVGIVIGSRNRLAKRGCCPGWSSTQKQTYININCIKNSSVTNTKFYREPALTSDLAIHDVQNAGISGYTMNSSWSAPFKTQGSVVTQWTVKKNCPNDLHLYITGTADQFAYARIGDVHALWHKRDMDGVIQINGDLTLPLLQLSLSTDQWRGLCHYHHHS